MTGLEASEAAFGFSPPPRPEVAPPGTWSFPRPRELRAANGLRVLGYHLPGQRLVSANLVMDVPPGREPEGLDGVGLMTARALDEGTAHRDAEEFASELERHGASFHAGADRAGVTARLSVPLRRLPKALALFAEAVIEPVFPEREVSRLVRQRLDEIAQQRANPRARVQVEFHRAVFAPESRQSRPVGGTVETVGRIDRDAVAAYYRERVTPAAATLVIACDLDGVDLAALVDETFGGRSETPAAPFEVPVPVAAEGTRAVLVDVPGAVQTQFTLGCTGTDRHHPDWVPLTVAAYALGGTITSRLDAYLREEKGYTYGVRGGFDPSRRGGTFSISGSVHTEVTGPALGDTLRLVRELVADGLRDDERDTAVDYFTRVAPLAYQTANAVAGRATELVANQLPLDYVDRTRDALAAVTAASASEAFARMIDPAGLTLVAVGDASVVTGPLREAGIDAIEVVES